MTFHDSLYLYGIYRYEVSGNCGSRCCVDSDGFVICLRILVTLECFMFKEETPYRGAPQHRDRGRMSSEHGLCSSIPTCPLLPLHISWPPSLDKYRARTMIRHRNGLIPTHAQVSFPYSGLIDRLVNSIVLDLDHMDSCIFGRLCKELCQPLALSGRSPCQWTEHGLDGREWHLGLMEPWIGGDRMVCG